MHILAAEQTTNFGDVTISLVGSLLVGAASVITIIVSNRNAAKMKESDYRREELNNIAASLVAARKLSEQLLPR